MRKATLIFALLWCAVSSFAQPTLADTTKLYFHDAKFSWRAPLSSLKTYIGAGTGTVTTFSAGNLSPLFTTSVSNASTTPALSFSLSTADENSYFGNPNGTAGAPAHTEAGSLSKTDDTNVTLTLGGSPTVSLLKNVSLTLGWTGQLSTSRGGTGLGSIGSAKSIMRVNGAGTALEYSAVQSIGTSLAVGTTSDAAASAVLDVVSTTKGFGLPAMTSAQKEGITSPRDGLAVYDTDIDGICVYDGVKWFRHSQRSTPSISLGAGAGSGDQTASVDGNDIEGVITVTTGKSPSASSTIFTLTFADSYSTSPKGALIGHVTGNLAALPAGQIPGSPAVTTTTLTLTNAATNGLADATTYKWSYRIIQ